MSPEVKTLYKLLKNKSFSFTVIGLRDVYIEMLNMRYYKERYNEIKNILRLLSEYGAGNQ